MRQVRTGVTEAAQALIAMMNRWGRIDRQGPGEREREREKEREQTQLMTYFRQRGLWL